MGMVRENPAPVPNTDWATGSAGSVLAKDSAYRRFCFGFRWRFPRTPEAKDFFHFHHHPSVFSALTSVHSADVLAESIRRHVFRPTFSNSPTRIKVFLRIG